MKRSSTSKPELPELPGVVCALDLETSGKDALKPDRADLAVVGLKVYIRVFRSDAADICHYSDGFADLWDDGFAEA